MSIGGFCFAQEAVKWLWRGYAILSHRPRLISVEEAVKWQPAVAVDTKKVVTSPSFYLYFSPGGPVRKDKNKDGDEKQVCLRSRGAPA